ncbi:hypothetical protein [Porphyromonas gingivalis]|uniref:Uncharacterized protein n=2 Tax=Porphyromonas gingivalis TaxID=837 RepID=B2RHL2_PORG3|nr:hypothetical protein [Porphyromonas gingivalis]AIJ35418.1 hypothetical protein EG14_04950 [Porphyromonas gingivalis]EIW92452.1 hypothetical protein HMPREF1322_1762 [Porphyromonas gingivalis W50]KXC08414.1 hypothetical protein AT291_07275 [Porphyromonas gingivalis]MCE8180281.1 hypothetical protein [Porphyromonas gingivalis]MDP0530316.1 hypothetical protein [Porphyromonas gingivalis]
MARQGKSSDEEVSFRDVMSANRYRKARNVFSNQVDMLIDWQRIRALLSIHLAAIHLLIDLSLRYKE